MVSGWSTHGKLACPYCMENNKAFTLTNGGKASFFYYHRRFLPHNHRYRKNRKDFFVGRVENDVAPPRHCLMLCQSTVKLHLINNVLNKTI